jgi:hypothetical protein
MTDSVIMKEQADALVRESRSAMLASIERLSHRELVALVVEKIEEAIELRHALELLRQKEQDRQVAAAKASRASRARTSPLYVAAREFFEDPDNFDLLHAYVWSKDALNRFDDAELLRRYSFASADRIFRRARSDIRRTRIAGRLAG